jgi:sulfonate transport system substrate-binding protein
MNPFPPPASSAALPRPRRDVLRAGTALLGAAAASVRPARAEVPARISVAVIGDGRTGLWGSLGVGSGERRLDDLLGTRIVWQPGFTASAPVMEAIKAGSVDFTFATATAVVLAVGARVPIVPLAAYPLPANEVDLLVHAAAPIHGAADLKGRKIAHQNGTTGTYSLIKYLESGGLRLSDVQAVSLTGTDAYTAFAQGSVDAWIHWQPAIALGLARLGDKARALPGVKTYDYGFYVARPELAEKAPATAAKFVRILRDTQREAAAHPAETIAAWVAQGGFAAGSLEAQVNRQLLVDGRLSESGAVALQPVDAAAAASTQDLADNFHALGVLPVASDVRGFLLSPKFDAIRAVVAAELKGGAA